MRVFLSVFISCFFVFSSRQHVNNEYLKCQLTILKTNPALGELTLAYHVFEHDDIVTGESG